jgi:hypothetical protein
MSDQTSDTADIPASLVIRPVFIAGSALAAGVACCAVTAFAVSRRNRRLLWTLQNRFRAPLVGRQWTFGDYWSDKRHRVDWSH